MLRAGRGQRIIRSLFSSYTTVTYMLRAGRGQRIIRSLFSSYTTVTYILRAGRGQKTIRSLFSSYETVTYILRAGRGQKTIRSMFSSYETQSHTSWGQAEVKKPSDHCSAAMKHSYIHPEGRKRSENHQITVQQLWNTVTYTLRAGRDQKTIRSLFSSYETQSHTGWGQEEVRKPSDHRSAAMKHSHIHAEGRTRSEYHQITVQQLWNTVTYHLKAGRVRKPSDH